MSKKLEVEQLEVVIYQRDVKEWHAIAFDITDKHNRKWLGEEICPTRQAAEQYKKDLEDFYLCDLEVSR